MKWITRERPKIDRIACPWLITRYIDESPEFLYVPAADVLRIASETGAIPFDVPNVERGHHADQCSFDAFIKKYNIQDQALDKLALIVRAADTAATELAKESHGLLMISRGLSMNFDNDHQMLAHGMVIYDALYAMCSNTPLTQPGKVLGV